MSRGRPDLPPQDSGQNRGFGQHQQQGFGPHQYEAGARRIEQGISMGMGAQALHQELQMIREAAMQNGRFNLAQYRADVRAIDAQLHKDGYLPKLHIDVDGKGQDIVRRGGGDAHSDDSSDSPSPRGRRHGRKSHGGGGRRRRGGGHGGGHRRGGHHRRGGAERSPSASEDPNQEGGPEQIASGDSIQENELRPDGGMRADRNNGGTFDRNNFRADRGGDTRGDNLRAGDRQFGSSERGLDKSTAVPSKNGFGEALLNRLGLPASERNLHFLDRWQKAEGGSPDNPFNTSQNAPGARRFNSHGVKRYPDMETGVEATAKTLRNGRYNGILAGLQQENPQLAAAHLKRSAWGTKHIYV